MSKLQHQLHVVFRVGQSDYVLPAADVVQMESYAGATPVPGVASHVDGIVQIRGRVVPVVNLRARFGLPAVTPTLDSRIVVTQVGTRAVALLADQAREVIDLGREQFEPPPAMVAEQAGGFVTAVARVGARLVMLLDVSKVVGEEPIDGH